MPKGNKGIKRPDCHPTEKSVQCLVENNIKRGLKTKKEWEAIAEANKMTCRTCTAEKNLELFSPRSHPDYKMWVKECRDCENKRKDEVAKKRVMNNGLEWNINQILRGIKQRSAKFQREIDIDTPFLVELFNKQNGICPYSGLKMIFDINSPERLSLDRIDSAKGYIKSNVVWCCWQANNIKQDLSMEDFKKWINIIHQKVNIETL
jgi:hypothetical protein